MKKRLSYSALSAFGKSPNHLLRYWSKKFEPTSAMMLGSLIHKIILEPDDFGFQCLKIQYSHGIEPFHHASRLTRIKS